LVAIICFINLPQYCIWALAISSISGLGLPCMIFLAFFAVITLGGMKVIGYTDVLVFFLILGGLVTTYLALNLVAKVWIYWSYKWF
jgi:hypothetical protein